MLDVENLQLKSIRAPFEQNSNAQSESKALHSHRVYALYKCAFEIQFRSFEVRSANEGRSGGLTLATRRDASRSRFQEVKKSHPYQ